MSDNGSLALVSYLSGGYKFASVLRCVGLVFLSLSIKDQVCQCMLLNKMLTFNSHKTSGDG